MRPLMRAPAPAPSVAPSVAPAAAPAPAPAATLRSDPAPSRLSYRMERMRLSPAYRLALRLGLPAVVIGALAGVILGSDSRRTAVIQAVADLRADIETRPEFMVTAMAIDGASPAVAADLRAALGVQLPQSSFHLDLDALRARAQALPAVRMAAVQIRPGGILQLDVTERAPVALWRTRAGLVLVDGDGVAVRSAAFRDDFPGLPLIAGDGADLAVTEALAIVQAAGPLTPRLRGLVRVGLRRWDVVLDGDQRLLLPEVAAVQALERVIAMDQAKDLLGRDVVVVDLRVPERLTVRMGQPATDAWWQVRADLLKGGNG